MSVSRRGFLKFGLGAALAGAVSGLGFNLRPAFAQAKEFKLKWTKQTTSICCYCAVGCGLIVSTSTSDNPLGKGRAINVEAGQHPFGLSNHYYWWILANTRGGPDELTSRIYYFDHPDAGGLLLPSGAAVLKASDDQATGQRFLAWLGSPTGGQRVVADYVAAPQFPVAPGVDSVADLPKVSELTFPTVDPDVFIDLSAAMDLILEAGIY